MGIMITKSLHLPPSYYNQVPVENAINDLTLQGGVSGSGISVKQSVDEAVNKIVNNPTGSPSETRALILLGDSAYDAGELPALVKETWGNETMGYGNDHNNIRVFVIMYLSSSGGCGSTTDSKVVRMREFGESAGGGYYCGASKAEIDQIYANIAQTLRDLAGVNVTMNLDFENVKVNSTPMSGGDAFSYVPVEAGFSSPSSRTTILWPNSTRTFKNQSDEWTAANNYQLNFDIGTIKVNQTWETTFRLNVNQMGVIQLFGSGSKTSFNNGTDKLIYLKHTSSHS